MDALVDILASPGHADTCADTLLHSLTALVTWGGFSGGAIGVDRPDGAADVLAAVGSVRARRAIDGQSSSLPTATSKGAASRAFRRRKVDSTADQQVELRVLPGISGGPSGVLAVSFDSPDELAEGWRELLDVLASSSARVIAVEHLAQRVAGQREAFLAETDALRLASTAFEVSFTEAAIGMVSLSLAEAGSAHIERVNDRFCRLTGYRDTDIIDRGLGEFVHPDDVGALESAIRRTQAGRRTPFERELRLMTAEGTSIAVELTAAPVIDYAGAAVSLLVQVIPQRDDHGSEAERAARQDAETGLLTMVALEDRLTDFVQRARRQHTTGAVVVADLGPILELAGRAGTADLASVRAELAERLRSTMRTGDLLSRIGDNQFVIAAEEVRPEHLEAVIGRITSALTYTGTIDGDAVTVAPDVGATVLSSTSEPGAALVRAATVNLYRAKPRGDTTQLLWSREQRQS